MANLGHSRGISSLGSRRRRTITLPAMKFLAFLLAAVTAAASANAASDYDLIFVGGAYLLPWAPILLSYPSPNVQVASPHASPLPGLQLPTPSSRFSSSSRVLTQRRWSKASFPAFSYPTWPLDLPRKSSISPTQRTISAGEWRGCPPDMLLVVAPP